MNHTNRKNDVAQRQNRHKKHRNDIILAVVMIFVAAAGFLLYKGTQKTGSYVAVIQDGEEIQRFSLSEEVEYRIEQEDGHYNLLCIKGGKAYMQSADCPDQICVNHRPVNHVGETIVCLPNELVIKVISSETAPEIDMVI